MKDKLLTTEHKKYRWLLPLILAGIFAGMLLLNMLSPLAVDDFTYLYSFQDKTRVTRISQIFPSMWAHRSSMNGRIIAHGLVQLMGMLPLWVFDAINAGMFLLQLLMMDYIGRGRQKACPGMMIALFCMVWLYCPAFGQVNLWQDGACNYLWSVVFTLLFLVPFLRAYLEENKPKFNRGGVLCYWLLAFCAGAYSEAVSAAAIGMAVLLLLLMGFWQKKKHSPVLITALILAFLGYVSIYTAPAQWMNKSAEMSIQVLLSNLWYVIKCYIRSYWVLLLLFAGAFAGNVGMKTDPKRIFLSLVFFLGSCAAQGILLFASYYSDRSSVGAFAFLTVADWLLLYPLLEGRWLRRGVALAMVVLVLYAIPVGIDGLRDIVRTYQVMQENEESIYAHKEAGILEVTLPVFWPRTKYSELYGLRYLDTEIPPTWPNGMMAVYYGVDVIYGVDEG